MCCCSGLTFDFFGGFEQGVDASLRWHDGGGRSYWGWVVGCALLAWVFAASRGATTPPPSRLFRKILF
jgi:hypothetical protein